uniref:Putative transposase n=1 Tax=Burkholderia sp. JS667 TaxID=622617 RepID=C3UVC9_9BURK|nr:putative transposase [Burkholderia sp. JS667]
MASNRGRFIHWCQYRCIWPRRQDLVSIAVNREAKHTPQVDALQPGGRNLPDQFRWNDCGFR